MKKKVPRGPTKLSQFRLPDESLADVGLIAETYATTKTGAVKIAIKDVADRIRKARGVKK